VREPPGTPPLVLLPLCTAAPLLRASKRQVGLEGCLLRSAALSQLRGESMGQKGVPFLPEVVKLDRSYTTASVRSINIRTGFWAYSSLRFAGEKVSPHPRPSIGTI